MTTTIKVTRKAAQLLGHMLTYREIDSPVTGITAMHNGVGPGSFFPLILRLERAQFVRSEWEVLPEGVDRPRRRHYYLTEQGAEFARRAVAERKNRRPWWKRLIRALDDVTEGDD